MNGLCYVIPRIGAIIGLAIAGLAGLFGNLDLSHWLILVAGPATVQAIEGFILTPKILGDRLRLSPLVVMLTLIVGSMVFGPVGLLISVPLVAVLNVFWRYSRQSRTG